MDVSPRQLLIHAPADPAAWYEAARTAAGGGNADLALTYLVRTARLAPMAAAVPATIGALLINRAEMDAARSSLHRALALEPDLLDGWINLARRARLSGDDAAAARAYARVIALSPDHAEAWSRLGEHLLRLGDLPRGFAAWRWRWQAAGHQDPYAMADRLAPWDGRPANGPAGLLVIGDQGNGDSLQFCRFLPAALARWGGGPIYVVVLDTILSLLRRSFPDPRLVFLPWSWLAGPRPEQASCAAFTLLADLPGWLSAHLGNLPPAPYLRADPTRIATWQARRAPGRRAIGLVWAGNPAHPLDRLRSISADRLAPLRALAATEFWSLQVGPGAAHRPDWVANIAVDLHDFDDTAAAIMALDLVVTVDTAVAHLAGGLGRPVWVLVATESDWRWMRERSDSPWYSTLQLFRQPRPGDWATPIAAVVSQLPTILPPLPARVEDR